MRLLLVEDEEKLARLVKRALTSERFSVDMALAGREGMDLANTYDYDLLILEHRDVGRTCLVSRAKPTSMAGRWERCEGLLVGADGSCGQRISRPPTRRLGHALFRQPPLEVLEGRRVRQRRVILCLRRVHSIHLTCNPR